MLRKAMILLAAISFVGAMVAATAADAQRGGGFRGGGGGFRGGGGGFVGGGMRGGFGGGGFRGGLAGPACEAGLPVLASGAPVSAEISSARGSHVSVVAASGSASRRSSSARGSTPGPTTTDAGPTHHGVPAMSAEAGADMATTRSGHSTTG